MAGKRRVNRWSAHVNETSNAMDVQKDVFKSGSAEEIARSLKLSAETSGRRKASPFQSAMSMLNFYINRAGKTLPDKQRKTLEATKNDLREDFGRDPK